MTLARRRRGPLAGFLIPIYLVQLEIRRWRGGVQDEGGHGE